MTGITNTIDRRGRPRSSLPASPTTQMFRTRRKLGSAPRDSAMSAHPDCRSSRPPIALRIACLQHTNVHTPKDGFGAKPESVATTWL